MNLIKGERRICRHLHIPLQSGDDQILGAMNRNSSTADYKRLVENLKAEIPDLCVGADMIVGFPGEKEEEFQNTCQFIQSISLSYLHVFSYSDRKGTLASVLPDKIDPKIIRKRSKLLHQISRGKWLRFLDSFIGKGLEVLVEKRRDKKTGKLIGLSDNYIRFLLEGDDISANQTLSIDVLKREGSFLIGRQRLC